MASEKRRWWPVVLAVLAVVLLGGYGWLFFTSPAPEGEWSLDLAELRRLAGSMPDDKPTQIRIEEVAQFQFPNAVTRTGDGWGMHPMSVYSYQLVFRTQTAIIDAALTKTDLPGGSLKADAVARVAKGLSDASLIVITHEHIDHIEGLLTHPDVAKVLKVAKLNLEQTQHPELHEPSVFPAGVSLETIQYDRMVAVLPGVVLVRAPGHTPGSQLVFVQRADGEEVLFLGDVAWLMSNIEAIQGRPRLAHVLMNENSAGVMRQLEQLNQFSHANPSIRIVPGHDRAHIDSLTERGVFVRQFTAASAAAPQE